MTPEQARTWIIDAMTQWATHAPELRELDAAVGDGDLGVTVSRGTDAVTAALIALPEAPTLPQMCRVAGGTFAKGSPSTMAALLGGGLLAAAKALADQPGFGQDAAHTVLATVIESIATRGRSSLGDKTILDAMIPSLDALAGAAGGPPRMALDAMATAAEAAVTATTGSIARRGRAAWLQERSAGHADPGATAYALLLRALQHAWPTTESAPEEP